MEGVLLAVYVSESSGKKPQWQTDFVKFDDISAQLLGFTDRSQAELKWKLHLKDADVATPVPSDPKHSHAPNVDETSHCVYVHEVTSCGQEILAYLAAPDEATKKQWMKCLVQAAKEGPHPPRFSGALSPRAIAESPPTLLPPYCFEARVTQVRLHSDGKHAEYMVTCHVSVFNRDADRRLAKEWNIWHRFSEFNALHEALKLSLGGEKMADVPFFKTHRDAVRSLFGWWSLDQDFLDHRRLLLDTFVCRACAIDSVTDFFQPHSSEHLKKFLAFDEHCEDANYRPCKPSKPSDQEAVQRGEHLRTSDMSPRDSDNTSASFSSAVMSPAAAPAVDSPSTNEATFHDEFREEIEQQSPKSPTKNSESPRPNARKKGKGREPSPTTKESCPAAIVANGTDVVRLPAPTNTAGNKKNRKKN